MGLGLAWAMKPVHELNAYANKFLLLLAQKPYGPYRAAELIFGTASADRLATDAFSGASQFLAPPAPQVPVLPAGRRMDDDNQDGGVGAALQPPRKRSRP